MEALWFCVVAVMLAIYAVLDGFNLGAGIIHLFLARGDSERRSMLAAASPFWDGNEVWLLLTGGALYCAFPAIFASRGFYLGAIVLLWLLVLRGIGMVLRGRIRNPNGQRVLGTALAIASVLLTVSLGAAIGYLVGTVARASGGVPDWLPALSALCGLAVLTLQSAAWIALKSNGELQSRCRRLASGVWWIVLLCYAAVTAASLTSQPHILESLLANSWICAFAVVALAGLIGTRLCLSIGFDLGVFASASCVIVGLLASVAASQFPYLVARNLTAYNATTAPQGVSASALWWIAAFLIAVGYNIVHHRSSRNRLPSRKLATVPARS
jgi:cytochrome d ubiquinol oxidase subunit II